jgi:hypothetical protein
MSHIAVGKILTSRTKYAGRSWYFDFSEIPNEFEENKVSAYVGKLQTELSPVTKNWTDELNTAWLIRHYMALKMLFTASIMLTSADYAYDKNIKVTDSYLQYYAVFSCLRAIVFTDPRSAWKSGALIQATHSKTINVATSIISSFSKSHGNSTKWYTNDLKDMREIYSYGAPSSGPSLCEDMTNVSHTNTVVLCQLLAEIAQLQSEILEMSLDKNFAGKFSLIREGSEKCFEYFISGQSIIDDEDVYRLGYYYRKWPRPTNLLNMVSEGHVEDYFGAWCSDDEDEDEDIYNPDDDWRVIFPFP